MHSFKEKHCITFQNLPENMINIYIFKLPYIIKLSRYIKVLFHVKSPQKVQS